MQFEDKTNELKVTFNELEIDNESIVENFIKWILRKRLFERNGLYLCKWQAIKQPTLFQDKRGYFPDINLKDKLIKKFSIKKEDTTYYFAIFKINAEVFDVGFVLKYCLSGQLFFVDNNEQLDSVFEKLKNAIQRSISTIKNLSTISLLDVFDLEGCKVIKIEQFDNPVTGINIWTFSLLPSK